MIWWQWGLVYAVGGVLLWLLAVPAALAGEAVRDAIGRRLPWSEHKRSAKRSAETVRRYANGEVYCPTHGWMLKSEAAEHTRGFHAHA